MSMGDTLTWQGNVPEFRIKRKRSNKSYWISYNATFFFNNRRRTPGFTFRVESGCTPAEVAAEMKKKWGRRRPTMAVNGGTITFHSNDEFSAIHEFRTATHRGIAFHLKKLVLLKTGSVSLSVTAS